MNSYQFTHRAYGDVYKIVVMTDNILNAVVAFYELYYTDEIIMVELI